MVAESELQESRTVNRTVIRPGQIWQHKLSGLKARVTFVESTGWIGVSYPLTKEQRRKGSVEREAGYWDEDLVEHFWRI